MGKVFGYPEFDENGEKILTTYDIKITMSSPEEIGKAIQKQ